MRRTVLRSINYINDKSNYMKFKIFIIFMLLSSLSGADETGLSDFLVGKYLLIGKAPDSEATYSGKLEIYRDKEKLKVLRKIGNMIVEGEAAIEYALNGDAEVLRIRFTEDSKDYEETCLFRPDLDNYARISCYWYQPGINTDKPGMEALFYDHTAN